MKFKKGDRVRCVDAGLSLADWLKHGAQYTVVSSRVDLCDEFVKLSGDPTGVDWRAWRFEPMRLGTVAPENRSRVDAGPNCGVR
jgi:hypothetical protein